MLGLALEGGGSNGAFHIGAVRALLEEGYTFDIIGGTSIGAFNAAVIVQGDFELCYELWENMTTSLIFDIEDDKLQNILHNKIDLDTLSYATNKLIEFITNKGFDTIKVKQLLDHYIDEDKLRASPIDLGIITVSLSDFKPLELYKEDIPYGKITSYLMASANFPIFKMEPLAGKYYFDGGIYDNCPINLLIKKGCTKIIAVRTFAIGRLQKPIDSHTTIVSITPSDDLGNILIFDNALIQHNIKLGYYDAKRALHDLKGRKYYIEPTKNNFYSKLLLLMPKEVISQISSALNLSLYIEMDPTRLLFEKIMPKLARLLKLDLHYSYEDLIIGLFESVAREINLERFKIYSLQEFVTALIESSLFSKDLPQKKSSLLKTGLVLIPLTYQTLNDNP